MPTSCSSCKGMDVFGPTRLSGIASVVPAGTLAGDRGLTGSSLPTLFSTAPGGAGASQAPALSCVLSVWQKLCDAFSRHESGLKRAKS